MSNLISINRGSFLGAYRDSQNGKFNPDEVFYITGLVLSSVLPEIIYCIYGGVAPIMVFGGSLLVGSTWGFIMYRRMPYPFISCVSRKTAQHAPPSESRKLKKTA
jgi:hypothetical protein